MKKGTSAAAGLLAVALLSLSFISRAAEGENVRLYGTLVAEPCVLRPGDENIPIDFGKIVDKYLYTNGRTPSQTFQLHLLECDLTIGKQVSVTFSGDESKVLPGMINVQPPDRGIVIGLENGQGSKQLINQQGDPIVLDKGSNTLEFRTYVQGLPVSLSGQGIVRGAFSATATFMLFYQ